jgi:hypothetical protein
VTLRILNSSEAPQGPHGIRYIHDSGRPWMVLRDTGIREICVGRYPNEADAKNAIRHALRMLESNREPRTAAGSLD